MTDYVKRLYLLLQDIIFMMSHQLVDKQLYDSISSSLNNIMFL